MAEFFTIVQYVDHLRRRARWIAITCVAAAALAFAASLLIPRQYTASARIIIDPPAGSDTRGTVGGNAIYLESLKSYEAFAASEQLFLEAMTHFQLRDAAHRPSFEALQTSVLRVRLVPNTRLLEIVCTLPDPRKAHALAVYLAEATIKLSRDVRQRADQELVARAERQVEEARARMEQAYTGAGIIAAVAEAQRAAARESFQEAERRLGTVRASAGNGGERLTLLDSGVVPERPSSPNAVLIVAAALLIGLTASILWLTLEFSYTNQRAASYARPSRGRYD